MTKFDPPLPPAPIADDPVDLARLELDTRQALVSIHALVAGRTVEIPETGRFAWGQWLDESRRLDGQWGRFGSSAGVQILALTHDVTAQSGTWQELARDERVAFERLFPNVLPEQNLEVPDNERQQSADRAEDPWKQKDFQQPMKLAFCVDALSPECREDVPGELPSLVRRLIALRLGPRPYWTTRSPRELAPPLHETLLVTAFCLLSLRRFRAAHSQERVLTAYRWLATNSTAPEVGPDLLALCGLALLGATGPSATDPAIATARRECDRRLAEWVAENRQPIIERPWFNPYVRGARVDYMFLSPEIVVCLYFLKRGMRELVSDYVQMVVRAIVTNVNSGATDYHGLRVQAGQEGTVDQLWAVRLLLAWRDWWEEERRARTLAVATKTVEREVRALRRAATTWQARGVAVAALAALAGAGVASAMSRNVWLLALTPVVGFVSGKVLDAFVGDRLLAWFRRRRSG